MIACDGLSLQAHPTKPENKLKAVYLNILKCFTTRLDGIQPLVIVHPVNMKKGFIKREHPSQAFKV
ncbi:hypothetical protein [uncultured Gammaproteobacteria bacterium]|nr:hypothetical protein [uncultured Gammaproteobacteria bacterium]CAC9442417.1 hypothetical protein [uncultured Gammaproteobacteria bacterium]